MLSSTRVLGLFGLVVALACLSPARAQQPCSYQGYDFTALQQDGDMFGNDNTGTDTFDYALHVCGPLLSQPACTSILATSSACQLLVSPKGDPNDLGDWTAASPAVWSFASEGTPMYTIQGAQSCLYGTGVTNPWYSTVIFQCADKLGTMQVSAPSNGCNVNYTIPTPLACHPVVPQNQPSSGGVLSIGWFCVIGFCVMVPLYIIIGCVYNSSRGSTGVDRCPNWTFWRDLPGLVKDGFVFTFSKMCRSKQKSSGHLQEGSYGAIVP